VSPALTQWPTGVPTDEQIAHAPSCMPGAKPLEPQRLGADVVVDEEGELVSQDERS
jgi:hypothetical protein